MEVLSSISVFLLRSILISGLLSAYYRWFLRNRSFHRYNRLYLGGIVWLSFLLPLIPLPVVYQWPVSGSSPIVTGTLHAIVSGDWNKTSEGIVATGGAGTGIATWQWGCCVLYSLVAVILLVDFLRQLRYVRRLLKRYPRERMGD